MLHRKGYYMTGPGERPSTPDDGEPASPDTSLGHGMVAAGSGLMARYILVDPTSALLPEGKSIGRYDEDTVVVSASVPTTPPEGKPDAQTQFTLVRSFIEQERIDSAEPFIPRPTFLTEEEVIKQLHPEDFDD